MGSVAHRRDVPPDTTGQLCMVKVVAGSSGYDSESLDGYVTRWEFRELVDKVTTLERDILGCLEDIHSLLE